MLKLKQLDKDGSTVIELGLRALILFIVFFGLMPTVESLPLIEFFLAIIISAQMILYNQSLQDPEDSSGFFSKISPAWVRALYALEILVLSLLVPNLYYFVPVFSFDIELKREGSGLYFVGIVVLGVILQYDIFTILVICGLSLLVAYLNHVMKDHAALETSAYSEIDTLRELNEEIAAQQEQLVRAQNEIVQDSMLEERKRISSELHDNIGHQLSSAIIQVAALEYTTEDEETGAKLAAVKTTLQESMDNIREIIHTERQTSINLERELEILVEDFTKSPLTFQYDNRTALDNETAHTVVSIVREALTNINKHSNATHVIIRFIELRDKWTLLISDNGSKARKQNRGGIGLMNMEERVERLNGTIHITDSNGFRIFITLPMPEEV